MKKIVVLLIIFSFLLTPLSVKAEYYFNPHFIITDEEMTDYDSLSLVGIQRFLTEQNSGLAPLYLEDYQGKVVKASQIIWQAAQESKINPKVILATLQKEQSLVGNIFPSQKQLDRAMGYRCPDDGSCNVSTLHFGKQVDGAAWQFRQYLDNPHDWTYQAGQQYEIDGFIIAPVNQATASLYNYTPHYSGNSRFSKIWLDYWAKDYPDGSLLKAPGSPGVWLVQYGGRRLITSWGVLLSRFDPRKILTVSQTDLEKYEVGPSIKFHNYSLLATPNGKIYLLVNDELRHITTPEVFRQIGFNYEEVEPVVEADLAGYIMGQEITLESTYPTGALLQDNQSGGVYFVENGIKYPIYSREIMKANFSGKVLTAVSPEILDAYLGGLPVKFKDGELIRANDDAKVYVISNGERRWLKTEAAFDRFSYKWDNIITTTPQAVAIHPLGADIE